MSIKVPGSMMNIPRFASKVVVVGKPSSEVKERLELIQKRLEKDEEEFASRRERMLTRELAKLPEPPMLARELEELRGEEKKISRHADDMVDARSSLTARSSALHLELDALMLKLKTVDDDIDDHTQRLLVLWEQREEAKAKRQAKETQISANETAHQNAVDKVNNRFMADTEGVRNRISNHKRNLAALKVRHPEAFEEDNREQTTEKAPAESAQAAE